MRLTDYLCAGLITTELQATDREGVFEEMVDVMVRQGVIRERETALTRLRVRESKMSTGISRGLALPHGMLEGVDGVALSIGLSHRGIEYGSLDHEPVHVVVMVFSEQGNPGPHIQALSEIARIFGNELFTQSVLKAPDAEGVLRLIREEA